MVFDRRTSGILLHPTSLPGPNGCGDLGPGAYHFVDWLASAGQSLWQVLPLMPIGPANSPYMSVSAFAYHVFVNEQNIAVTVTNDIVIIVLPIVC